jgi:hypothetical protein
MTADRNSVQFNPIHASSTGPLVGKADLVNAAEVGICHKTTFGEPLDVQRVPSERQE